MSHLLSCLGGNIWLAVLSASKDLGQECSACKGFIPSLGGFWVLGIGLLGALKTFGMGWGLRPDLGFSLGSSCVSIRGWSVDQDEKNLRRN